jgi:hypothetical protein
MSGLDAAATAGWTDLADFVDAARAIAAARPSRPGACN